MLIDALDKSTMESILASVIKMLGKQWYKRFFKFLRNPDRVAEIRKRLDDAVGRFTVSGRV